MTIRTIAAALATIALAATAHAQDPVHWTASKTAEILPSQVAKPSRHALCHHRRGVAYLLSDPRSGGSSQNRHRARAWTACSCSTGPSKAPPQAKFEFDPNFGINVETYESKAEFTVPIKVDSAVKNGAQKINLSTRYEACNASMCLPPKTVSFAVDMKVKARKS